MRQHNNHQTVSKVAVIMLDFNYESDIRDIYFFITHKN